MLRRFNFAMNVVKISQKLLTLIFMNVKYMKAENNLITGNHQYFHLTDLSSYFLIGEPEVLKKGKKLRKE